MNENEEYQVIDDYGQEGNQNQEEYYDEVAPYQSVEQYQNKNAPNMMSNFKNTHNIQNLNILTNSAQS